jgi:YesN/AraC family two-component response regulator
VVIADIAMPSLNGLDAGPAIETGKSRRKADLSYDEQ